MLRTVVARTANEMTALRSRWESLYRHCRATTFQSFKWNWLAAQIFEDRESPYIVYSESDHGIALLPFCIHQQRNSLACIGDVLFDYRNVLTFGEDDALKAAWSEVTRAGLPFSSGGLIGSASDSWTAFQLNQFYRAPQVRVRDIAADQFAARHARCASRLRRLERLGIVLKEHNPVPDALMRWIYEQKACQPPEAGENVFADPRRIEFMSALASVEPHTEEVFTLNFGVHCIAALVTLREAHCRRFYTIWFDQSWSHYSPGICLIYEVTRRSLAGGIDCDYMTGEQAYKMRFATSVEPLYWIDASVEQLRSLGMVQAKIAA